MANRDWTAADRLYHDARLPKGIKLVGDTAYRQDAGGAWRQLSASEEAAVANQMRESCRLKPRTTK